MQRSMDAWHNGQQGDAKEARRSKRERDTVEGQTTAKRGRSGGEEKREGKDEGPTVGGMSPDPRWPHAAGSWGPIICRAEFPE